MRISAKFLLAALLCGMSVTAKAEGVGGYVGAGLGIPTVAYGSSSVAIKISGGYKVHTFEIKNGGGIELAVEGEYVDFGSSNSPGNSWSNSGFGVAAVGSWVIPRHMWEAAEEKFAVIAKLGGASISTKANCFGCNYTNTGVTEGVGAEYRFTPAIAVRAMAEYYPNGYDLIGVSGIFRF